jgi:trehalose 6-phosphate phosphatase
VTSPDPLPRLLAPFVEQPERAGVITDFTGTFAPIVLDPGTAVALPGAVDVLHELATRYATVAVVSGRPVSFLIDRLDLEKRPAPIVLSGLYGLERAKGSDVEEHPRSSEWRTLVTEIADRAEAEAPVGVDVERKGLTLTLHVRAAPEHDGWARSCAETQSGVSGFEVHRARMSYELRPPVRIDKGTVVAGLAEGLGAACFFGDDRGDLPAFDALDRARADHDAATLKVGVRSDEAPLELLERADVLVDGPAGVLDLMRKLLASS